MNIHSQTDSDREIESELGSKGDVEVHLAKG